MVEEKMCPQCGSPLHAVSADEGWVKRPVLWCMACSYKSHERAGVVRPTKHLRGVEGMLLAAVMNEENFPRRDFEKLKERYYEEGIELGEAYLYARATPGRWVVADHTTIVDPLNFLRALVGLPWVMDEKYMAVRYRKSDDTVVLAQDADKVLPAGSLRPRWYQMAWRVLTALRIQMVDRDRNQTPCL